MAAVPMATFIKDKKRFIIKRTQKDLYKETGKIEARTTYTSVYLASVDILIFEHCLQNWSKIDFELDISQYLARLKIYIEISAIKTNAKI